MKNSLFVQFTGRFVLYLAIIMAVAAFPLYRFGDPFLINGSAESMAFFAVLTIASYYIVVRSIKKDGTVITAFLGGMVLKLLLAMVFLFVVIKNFSTHEVDFVAGFFAAYLICTGFEVYYILHNLRQN